MSCWEEFLHAGCRYFSAPGANFIHLDRASPELSLSFIVGFEHADIELQELVARKQVELRDKDPRIAYAMENPNKPFRCTDVMPVQEFHGTRVYRELLQPSGVEHSLMVQYSESPEAFTGLAFLRGPNDLPFTPDDSIRLGELVPHLRRALAIQRQLSRMDHQMQASYEVLDTLPTGVAIADDSGLVEFANTVAFDIFNQRDGIELRNRKLYVPARRSEVNLLEVVRAVAQGRENSVVTVVRPSAKPGFECFVTRLARPQRGLLPNLLARPRVALYLSDPAQPLETPAELLQRMFGLTPAEARVLQCLLAGQDVEGAAAEIGVGVATVRSQVQAILLKTDSSRQADVIQKVMSSPLWMARGKPKMRIPQ